MSTSTLTCYLHFVNMVRLYEISCPLGRVVQERLEPEFAECQAPSSHPTHCTSVLPREYCENLSCSLRGLRNESQMQVHTKGGCS